MIKLFQEKCVGFWVGCLMVHLSGHLFTFDTVGYSCILVYLGCI